MRKVLAALMAAVLLAGCGSANGDGALVIEDPPPKPDASQVTDPAVEEEILAAWRGYGDALDEVYRGTPDPDSPLLAEYTTGQTLENIRAAAARNREEGITTALPEDSVSEEWPEVVSVNGDTATVRSCEVDDGLLVIAETGEVLDDDVVTYLIGATLVREGGRWKVSYDSVEDEWEGVAGCALDHQ